jgi:uncharacterized protein (TIGR02246 family)
MRLPRTPEEWPGVFDQHLNAGDIDAVVALYEPEARFVTRSGETVVGRDGIRDTIAQLIATRTQLHSRVVKTVDVGDVALLYTDFRGSALDSSGQTVEVRYKAIEVLRRQPDRSWKLIVGDPNGRDPLPDDQG